MVQVAFGADGIAMEVEHGGSVRKPWHEFTRAADTRRGVLLYFGSMTLLMPRRVFASDEERREFVKYVTQFEPTDTPL